MKHIGRLQKIKYLVIMVIIPILLPHCMSKSNMDILFERSDKPFFGYMVGGQINNLLGSIDIENRVNTDTITINSDGFFVMPSALLDEEIFDIIPGDNSDDGQVCLVKGGNGRIDGADITSVEINCYPNNPASITSFSNCPASPTNNPNVDITVNGDYLAYYSYKIYKNGSLYSDWSGRIDPFAHIILSATTFSQDATYKIEARGINVADIWEGNDASGNPIPAYTYKTCTWTLDTTAPDADNPPLNPGTDPITGNPITPIQADTNFQNIMFVYTHYVSPADKKLINADGTSVNKTGQLYVEKNTAGTSDVTQYRYLFVNAAGTAIGSWSAAKPLTASIDTIPTAALSTDGVYGVYFSLGDAAGNWSCACSSTSDRSGTAYRTFEFDKTPPIIAQSGTDVQMSGLPGGSSSLTSITVNLSALTNASGKPLATGGTPIVSYSYDLDAPFSYTTVNNLSIPISYAGLSAGSHTLSIKITDAAGNESTPYNFTWIVDLTTVMARYDSGLPAAYASTFNPAGVDVNADGTPAAYLWYRTTGNTCSSNLADYISGEVPMGTNIMLPALPAGITQQYSICAVAKTTTLPTKYNNKLPGSLLASDITKYTFTGDTKAPESAAIIITGGALATFANGAILNKTQIAAIRSASASDITFTASDSGAPITKYNYRILINGVEQTSYTNKNIGTAINLIAADLPATGDYTLDVEIIAQDSAGNIGNYTSAMPLYKKALYYTVDQTEPDLPINLEFALSSPLYKTVDPTPIPATPYAYYTVPAGSFTAPNAALNGSTLAAFNIGRVDFDSNLTAGYTRPASWDSEPGAVTIQIDLNASENWPSATSMRNVRQAVMTDSAGTTTCAFNNMDENGIAYYLKFRVGDAAGNYTGWYYPGSAGYVAEASIAANAAAVNAKNIKSVGLCKAVVKDASNGALVNNAWVTMYNTLSGSLMGIVRTNADNINGNADDGRVQALVRKGDNIYVGKFEDLVPLQLNPLVTGKTQLSGYRFAAKNNVSARPGQVLEYSLLLTPSSAIDIDRISGSIIDANDGSPVVGSTFKLILWDGTEIINENLTGSTFSFLNNGSPYTIDPGTYTIEISKVGYYTIKVDNVYLDGNKALNVDLGRIALCGRLLEPQVRVFVQWGASPADLDLHLVGRSAKNVTETVNAETGYRFHVFFKQENFNENTGNYDTANPGDTIGNRSTAALVQDNINNYGPETINIYGYGSGYAYGSYKFSLFNYTERAKTTPLEWNTNYPITARIYDSNGLVLEIPFPYNSAVANDTWRMFELNISGVGRENRAINVISSFVDRNSPQYSSKSASTGMDW